MDGRTECQFFFQKKKKKKEKTKNKKTTTTKKKKKKTTKNVLTEFALMLRYYVNISFAI